MKPPASFLAEQGKSKTDVECPQGSRVFHFWHAQAKRAQEPSQIGFIQSLKESLLREQ